MSSFWITHEAHLFQLPLLAAGKDKMISPFEEVGSGLNLHALGELTRRSVPLLESGDLTAQESFGVVGQRPVKGLRRWIHVEARRRF